VNNHLLKGFVHDFTDALLGLRRRPGRFLLSGTGIGIGVSALLAMLSIGEGAHQAVMNQIATLGINTIRIESVSRPDNPDTRDRANRLTIADMNLVRDAIGSKGHVGGYLKSPAATVQSATSTKVPVLAVTPDWIAAENLRAARGRLLTVSDLDQQRRVCVVGSDLSHALNIGIGTLVKIDNSLCEIIGIFKAKERLMTNGTSLSPLDFRQLVLMPLTLQTHMGSQHSTLDGLTVALFDSSEQSILNSAETIDNLLRQPHLENQGYRLVTPIGLLIESKKTQHTFSLVMGVIAGLSLLVGGIGVMNVMLANITEQTREIGLRMALGAHRARIIGLYLWQSVQLTLVSGLWGIGGGIAIAFWVQFYAGWPIAFSTFALLAGPLFAIVTGIIFGLQPAFHAAAISPAAALREN